LLFLGSNFLLVLFFQPIRIFNSDHIYIQKEIKLNHNEKNCNHFLIIIISNSFFSFRNTNRSRVSRARSSPLLIEQGHTLATSIQFEKVLHLLNLPFKLTCSFLLFLSLLKLISFYQLFLLLVFSSNRTMNNERELGGSHATPRNSIQKSH